MWQLESFPGWRRASSALALATALALGTAGSALAHRAVSASVAEVDAQLAARPLEAELYLRRGELYRDLGQPGAALADYDRAAALAGGLPVADLLRGELLLELGRLEEAELALDRYLERAPGDARGRVARARLRAAEGRPRDAALDYTAAIEEAWAVGQPSPDWYLERARAQRATGARGIEEASTGLDEGIARLGAVALELEAIELDVARAAWPAALARLERIMRASPRQERWLARRGEILELAGQPEAAGAAYRAALSAIAALPPARRSTRALERLEQQVAAALARLQAAEAQPAGAGGVP